jgi:predicted transcriptional regulator YheO
MSIPRLLEDLTKVAKGICATFGSDCEVVIHDLHNNSIENSIVFIENGHISGREVGDGPSRPVLEALKADPATLEDKLAYLIKTRDGKVLKCSTMYIRGDDDSIVAVLSINFDITTMQQIQSNITQLISPSEGSSEDIMPESIQNNVNDLLDDLIDQSVKLVGKPVYDMTKEDKIKAIQFLNDSGAFLIMKSGDKVSNHFRISKYTLYSYIDAAKNA